MYTLMHRVGPRSALLTEAPSLLLSMIVAELFYKFHSFTLECAAFLATWLALSAVHAGVRRWVSAGGDLRVQRTPR